MGKDVFVMGAGFSSALSGGQVPAMNRLMEMVRVRYKEKFSQREGNNIIDNYDDLEFLLSSIFIKQPYGSESAYFQGLSTYHDITKILVDVLKESELPYYSEWKKFLDQRDAVNGINFGAAANNNQLGDMWLNNFWRTYSGQGQYHLNAWVSPLECNWFSALIKGIFQQEDVTVITFNYDTLIELEWCFQLIYILNFANNYKQPAEKGILVCNTLFSLVEFGVVTAAQSLYPKRIPLSGSRFMQDSTWDSMSTPIKYSEPTFKLLKLHGSINLCWDSDLQSQVYIQDDSSDDLSPFIIPPILDKTNQLNHPYLKLNWRLAKKALEEAERIFLLGYSLPLTDFSTRSLFFQSQFCNNPKKLEIYPINCDPSVKNNVKKVFSKSDIKENFLKENEDVLSNFVSWYLG